MTRRHSRQVSIGGVTVGGDAPVRVQSMTITKTFDVAATLAQIDGLAALGCELVRVAVPFDEDAAALPEIARRSPIPVIADIHFTWRHALDALEAGIPGLRVNPGTIGDRRRGPGQGRPDPDRGQRRLARPRAAPNVRFAHGRGAGRIGAPRVPRPGG